jgi:ribosome biogenesis GTPase
MCQLRGKLMKDAQSSDIAAIGDRVKIQPLKDGKGTILEVESRTSVLSRSARTEGNRGAGNAEREQVIIANADQAFFVFAAAAPTPQPRQLDRFLVIGEQSGIENLYVVVNKIDLSTSKDIEANFGAYRRIGYEVIQTSALTGEGTEQLKKLLHDHISVFTGPSGVGKTSLLNSVQPGLGRVVKEVSQSTKLGVHTTRYSELIKVNESSYLADTPGLRYLTLWDVEPEELDAYFREIAPLVSECHFGDCTHHDEPNCAVREAAKVGSIPLERYESYLSLRDELEQAYVF